MSRIPDYITHYWGKAVASPDGSLVSHPLAYHMLDVGAVANALLQVRPQTLHRFSQLLGIPETDVCHLLPLVSTLHDLGKFGRSFQCKVPALWHVSGSIPSPRAHTVDGWLFWAGRLGEDDGFCHSASTRIWPFGLDALDVLMRASLGHHGRPLSNQQDDTDILRAFGSGMVDARIFATEVIDLLLPLPLSTTAPKSVLVDQASFYVSGFVTLTDWVGSNRQWFDCDAPEYDLATYWDIAKAAAECAVEECGLTESIPALSKTFAQLTDIETPSPMQQWAESVQLADGPALYIIEDVTGAGKTEAAQMLVHRLLSAGQASGAYWAMPTGATANAMFIRQERMIRGLYADGVSPRLTLAHGQAKLSDAFQKLVHPSQNMDGDEDDVSAGASCTDFLAHDKRVSLIADVGAGTVDQALLGALPVKFNTLRLFGLATKVLVFDEAHAYDPYVGAEIEGLLAFQAALGGSAVILSATLPQTMREKYVRAWQRGLRVPETRLGDIRRPYPLTTVVAASVSEDAVSVSERSLRRVPVRLVHDKAEVVERLVSASATGAACVWIRNTVDDVLEAVKALQERGIAPMVFHARFAQCDRQTREQEVMRCFGKDSDCVRRGRVLVASQVVEQSLDLDFDVLVSDLAPIDLLIQRAGRLHRHRRLRPDGIMLEMLVLSPEPVAEPARDWIKAFLPGTAAVYRQTNVLWRTARVLSDREAIVSPDGLRDLIEYVYGPNADDDVPEALWQATVEAGGIAKANRSLGQQAVLRPHQGYIRLTSWEDERKVSTRLIDGQVTVRLGCLVDGGSVVPYAKDVDPYKAWALSEVRVRPRIVPPDAAPPPELQEAVGAVRGSWGRYEQDLPLIVLEPAGNGWRGSYLHLENARSVYYNALQGLHK